MNANGLGLCEVAENRSEKIRFRRHVAKANFYLLNYEKKPIKLAFADYEAQNFNLPLNPPFCKTLVSGSTSYFPLFIRLSSLHNIWQFSADVFPPSCQGVMWSASISESSKCSPHFTQIPFCLSYASRL